MKLLAVDYGLKRVGLAVSPDGSMAFPRPALARQSDKQLADDLAALAIQESAQAFILGLPLALDGSETPRSAQVRALARKLQGRTGLAVHLVDERLSSAEAEARLREAGVSARKQKDKVDSQAAVIILESYLRQTAGHETT